MRRARLFYDLYLSSGNFWTVPCPRIMCLASGGTRRDRPRCNTPWRAQFAPCFLHNRVGRRCCHAKITCNVWVVTQFPPWAPRGHGEIVTHDRDATSYIVTYEQLAWANSHRGRIKKERKTSMNLSHKALIFKRIGSHRNNSRPTLSDFKISTSLASSLSAGLPRRWRWITLTATGFRSS